MKRPVSKLALLILYKAIEKRVKAAAVLPGMILSVLFGVAFSAYLILEMQTNEQLLSLNHKLKTLQIGRW